MKTHYSRAVGVASISGLVALTGCSSEDKKYREWMETSGASNRINLDEVREALEKSKGVTDFENRVNEIYEGDHIVLIEVKDIGGGKKEIRGWEDVNDNKTLDTTQDFELFSTTVGGGNYSMRGGGAHHYYHYSGTYHSSNGFFLGYVMGSMMTPTYYTPSTRYVEIVRYRTAYRKSPSYRAQKSKNMAYRKAQVKKHPKAAKGFRSKISSKSYSKSSRSTRSSTSRSKSKGFRTGS